MLLVADTSGDFGKPVLKGWAQKDFWIPIPDIMVKINDFQVSRMNIVFRDILVRFPGSGNQPTMRYKIYLLSPTKI